MTPPVADAPIAEAPIAETPAAEPKRADRAPPSSRRETLPQLATARLDAQSASLVVLAVLAVFYTLYFAASIILPLLLAVLLSLLLRPGKRLLCERLRFPASLAALLLILGLFVLVSAVALAISVPASSWVAKAPQAMQAVQQKLGFLGPVIDSARSGLERLHTLLQGGGSGGSGGDAGAAQQMVTMQPQSNIGGVGIVILQSTRAFLGQVLTVLVVLFFTLAFGDSLLRRVVEIMPTFGEKRQVVDIAVEIERNISGYLLTITVMNLLVGIANGVSMWAQGLPDPLLWGTVAFLLNYIPILGPFTGVVLFSSWACSPPPASGARFCPQRFTWAFTSLRARP